MIYTLTLATAVAVACIGWLVAVRRCKDTIRINWLQATRSEIDTDGPGFVIYNGTKGEASELGGGASGGSYKRLRNAIDAAMRRSD